MKDLKNQKFDWSTVVTAVTICKWQQWLSISFSSFAFHYRRVFFFDVKQPYIVFAYLKRETKRRFFPLRIDRVCQLWRYLQCILCTRSKVDKTNVTQNNINAPCNTLPFDQTSTIDLFLKTHRLFSGILTHKYTI